jgi:hypothetical protein
MTRRVTFQFFALASLVTAIGYAVALNDGHAQQILGADSQQPVSPNGTDGTLGSGSRLREGVKLVNQVGELKNHAGTITFYPDGATHALQLLENLALERVAADLDQPNRKWSVTGIVTEYKGGNYLLLHRAVLKARPSTSPEPRS